MTRPSNIKDSFFLDCGASYDDPKDITGSTAASPVVITAVAHGFSNGDEVDIDEIEWEPTVDSYGGRTQPDQLNGNRYKVANKTNDTFELTDPDDDSNIDGSAFNAYRKSGKVRKAVRTISGLWHLEGEAVTILADGEIVTGETVANGAITLATKASRVHVGLPYYSEIETLDIENFGGNTVRDQTKQVATITVGVERSRGMIVGQGGGNFVPVKDAQFTGLDSTNGLLTGQFSVTPKSKYSVHGRIVLRQKNPLPMTVLWIAPDVEGED